MPWLVFLISCMNHFKGSSLPSASHHHVLRHGRHAERQEQCVQDAQRLGKSLVSLSQADASYSPFLVMASVIGIGSCAADFFITTLNLVSLFCTGYYYLRIHAHIRQGTGRSEFDRWPGSIPKTLGNRTQCLSAWYSDRLLPHDLARHV